VKNASRFLRDQLLMAQHHVNDAETAPNKQVLRSSLKDTEELLGRMSRVLPPRDQVSVRAEQHRKEGSLADPADRRNVSLKDTRMTTSDLLKQAADAETVDRANAFELGFARAAREAGLDEAAYQVMRKIGMAELEKLAAAKGEIAAQPETNKNLAAQPEAPQQEKAESSVKKVKKDATPSAIVGSGRGCK